MPPAYFECKIKRSGQGEQGFVEEKAVLIFWGEVAWLYSARPWALLSERDNGFLWQDRLERYIPLIPPPPNTHTLFLSPSPRSHVLKLIASGNEDALVSAVKSVSHILRQVDIYWQGVRERETACPGASNLGGDAMSQTPSHHSHRCTAYYLKGNKYRPLNVTARTRLLLLN